MVLEMVDGRVDRGGGLEGRGGGGVRGSSIKISLKRKLGLVIMVLKVNIFLVL